MPDVVVITGGAGGMGLATARLVGPDRSVVLGDVDEHKLQVAANELRSLGTTCETFTCDVTDPASVSGFAAYATSLGRVVSVVHTAGVSPRMGSPETILRVNALGTVHVDQAFLATAGPGFSLVNVASTAGHMPSAFPVPRRAYRSAFSDPRRMVKRLESRCRLVPVKVRPGFAYALSKNFVIWYSRQLAGPLGRMGARVVSVSPGSFDTEMGRLEDAAGAGELARRSALGRFGRVEEIAAVLAFCASDGPGYLTGTDLLVDGGGSAVMTLRDTLEMARSVL